MEAKVSQDGEIIVVHLSGKINYETADPFRDQCLNHLTNKKIIFNLRGLNFVGSNGITTFVDTMKDLANENASGLKVCGAGVEFKRIIDSLENQKIQVFETENQARMSHLQVQFAQYNQSYMQNPQFPQYASYPVHSQVASEPQVNTVQANTAHPNAAHPNTAHSNTTQSNIPQPPVAEVSPSSVEPVNVVQAPVEPGTTPSREAAAAQPSQYPAFKYPQEKD